MVKAMRLIRISMQPGSEQSVSGVIEFLVTNGGSGVMCDHASFVGATFVIDLSEALVSVQICVIVGHLK